MPYSTKSPIQVWQPSGGSGVCFDAFVLQRCGANHVANRLLEVLEEGGTAEVDVGGRSAACPDAVFVCVEDATAVTEYTVTAIKVDSKQIDADIPTSGM